MLRCNQIRYPWWMYERHLEIGKCKRWNLYFYICQFHYMQVMMEHVQVHYIQHNFSMTMNMRFPIHTLIGLVPNNNMNERMNYVG
jgi:hypothetical protein